MTDRPRIGFACSYTPLPVIDAAGFLPHRLLPTGDAPAQSGALLHDNLCPHVLRILDRALAGEFPPLAGVVVMNSCDAMRRLADAWRTTRPADRLIVLDLPMAPSAQLTADFREELTRLVDFLVAAGGVRPSDDALAESVATYQELASGLDLLRDRARRGVLPGGWAKLQEINNQSVTQPVGATLAAIGAILAEAEAPDGAARGAPIYLIGNVLPEPEALALFAECGARLAGEDLCTGARQHALLDFDGPGDALDCFARAWLARTPCARTFDAAAPGAVARLIAEKAKACGARGVVAHVMKFCDPYLARLPYIQDELQRQNLPLLTLMGDCGGGALGQFRTRLEAFVEMLGARS
jgi:benzoyl-CoA reductase/2-hydroxyglutaryl-CoA dehydratase subunit BcrC/BadD/HgdB